MRHCKAFVIRKAQIHFFLIRRLR